LGGKEFDFLMNDARLLDANDDAVEMDVDVVDADEGGNVIGSNVNLGG
jgi:hypothetical protein